MARARRQPSQTRSEQFQCPECARTSHAPQHSEPTDDAPTAWSVPQRKRAQEEQPRTRHSR